jgi:hypothetical protein
MPASPKHWLSHRSLRVAKENIVPQLWVPHLRDGFIVVKVGIVRSTTAPTHLHPVTIPKAQAAH